MKKFQHVNECEINNTTTQYYYNVLPQINFNIFFYTVSM